jgi:DNA-binding HxlR family transcriptional regulator
MVDREEIGRAGATVLSLLARPLCASVLRAHLDGPLRLWDLRERIGGGAQTTLRAQVRDLRGIGALEHRMRSGMPYTVENELTGAGRAIIEVADIVEAWLTVAPQGPIPLGSESAKRAIRALVGGWNSTMVRVLAAGPLSLTDLDSVIADLSYPSLERRLTAMRVARQVERLPIQGGSRPYAVTDWVRQAAGPLVVAGYCECRHLADVANPATGVDIETALLLAVPLVSVSARHSGSCLLVVKAGVADDEPVDRRAAGVHVKVDGGAISSCIASLDSKPTTWAVGSSKAWSDAIAHGQPGGLRLGGEQPELAHGLVAGLHEVLPRAGSTS